jgi:hypothetical protein
MIKIEGKNMINLQPTICNLCGGEVEYMSNAVIYGKQYGSGYCYRCRACKAYVGTHERRPREAFGILANAAMREWKMKCHSVFDRLWQSKTERFRYRSKYYNALAEKLNIDKKYCHFGYFDTPMLRQAYGIIISGELERAVSQDD